MLLNTHSTRWVVNERREAEFQLGRYRTGAVAVRRCRSAIDALPEAGRCDVVMGLSLTSGRGGARTSPGVREARRLAYAAVLARRSAEAHWENWLHAASLRPDIRGLALQSLTKNESGPKHGERVCGERSDPELADQQAAGKRGLRDGTARRA